MDNFRKFAEEEIRPAHLMKEHPKYKEEDRAFLLSRQAQFLSVTCPSCEASSEELKFSKQGFRYVECKACRTMYVNPRPSIPLLEEFYEISQNYAYWNRCLFPASEESRREKIFRPRVERILDFCTRFNIKPGLLLEIGAGFGTFCQEMTHKKYFQRIIAIEPTSELARTCMERGLEVLALPIERIEEKDIQADVIVSFEVIEHIFDPKDFLRAALRLLKPGGLLVLTCPNVAGFDMRVLGIHAPSFDYEHLNYFHPDSLSLLLNNVGFRVLDIMTPGELDVQIVARIASSGVIDLNNQPFIDDLILKGSDTLKDDFQSFLKQHKLSSHMWVVAQK